MTPESIEANLAIKHAHSLISNTTSEIQTEHCV